MNNSKLKLVSTIIHWRFGIFAVVLALLITAQLSLRELPALYPVIFTIGIANAILHGYEFAQWLSNCRSALDDAALQKYNCTVSFPMKTRQKISPFGTLLLSGLSHA